MPFSWFTIVSFLLFVVFLLIAIFRYRGEIGALLGGFGEAGVQFPPDALTAGARVLAVTCVLGGATATSAVIDFRDPGIPGEPDRAVFGTVYSGSEGEQEAAMDITVVLQKNGVDVGQDATDQNGEYEIAAPSAGTFTVDVLGGGGIPDPVGPYELDPAATTKKHVDIHMP